MVMGLKLGESN